MPNSLPSINLVQNKKVPFIDKFMDWALTVGRLIVILTEIIALLTFFYRFSLDEKLIDLHSVIKQKQAIISFLKQDEDKYRNLQDRIALASTYSEKIIKTNKIVMDVINLIPQGIKINDLTFNKDRISIDIDMASVLLLTNFVNPLRNLSEVKSVSIDSIESKPSIGLLASVTVMLK
ncbi:MAG: hypothetical protein A3H79_02790 [Candidatus Levybacteria bacterium RIFCSPLOWO2_02_FULL_36_8b]|nr:MAG: hypothetical protein A3H79_02790 [Candidatus Levybacteria bacterium RIFCSPLOWO2_02_FULL_36_8b]